MHLVVMVKVKVKGYGMHYVNEDPHKDRETQLHMCVWV